MHDRDRRTQRSERKLEALAFFLDAERERSGASLLAVFDGERVIAASGEPSARRDLVTLMRRSTSSRDHYVLSMHAGSRALSLACLDRRVRSVRSVERAVARILGAV